MTMRMRPVAMVGWSGAGTLEDLERTVVGKLALSPERMAHLDGSLVIDSDRPVGIATTASLMPGVPWVAVGYRFRGLEGCLARLEMLAERYMAKGGTFRISAHVATTGGSSDGRPSSEQTAGDAILAGNSAILSAVAKSKVDERKARLTFHVCGQAGLGEGACGVEIRSGPGGAPSRDADWVACLVSGGERSSAMAWLAALSGFSLRLVHSATDDTALRQVARLFSELSHRMDPRCLELIVLDGGGGGDDGDDGGGDEWESRAGEGSIGRIGAWLRDHRDDELRGMTFAGSRGERSDFIRSIAEHFPNLVFPLLLFQDDAVRATYRTLDLGRASDAAMRRSKFDLEGLERTTAYSETKVGGEVAEANTVIDTVRRRGKMRAATPTTTRPKGKTRAD